MVSVSRAFSQLFSNAYSVRGIANADVRAQVQAARFGMAFEPIAELSGGVDEAEAATQPEADGSRSRAHTSDEDGDGEERAERLSPDSWLFSLRLLRLLNTLRSAVAGLPLSHEQLVNDLRLPRLIDKCVDYTKASI